MFNKIAQKNHLVLKKGQNIHILFTLAVNYLLRIKLQIIKWMKGIDKPIVHYYGLCWNEEKMLPFMFDYYDQFVDHYTIYDNYSTDKSEEIIRSHKNAEIIKFKTDGFNDLLHIDIKNNCWKKSRGKADYVIVCDMDEFAFSSDMLSYLKELVDNNISLPDPKGYGMYCEKFPNYSIGCLITELIPMGIPDNGYSKHILFDPNRIVEINYEPGAHICKPIGIVNTMENLPYKMLHYKNIGIENFIERSKLSASRLSKSNIENGFGYAYLYSEEKMRSDFFEGLARCSNICER